MNVLTQPILQAVTVPQALVNTELNEFSESGEVFRSLQNMQISLDKNYDIRSPEIETVPKIPYLFLAHSAVY